jgi:hypothetical protein
VLFPSQQHSPGSSSSAYPVGFCATNLWTRFFIGGAYRPFGHTKIAPFSCNFVTPQRHEWRTSVKQISAHIRLLHNACRIAFPKEEGLQQSPNGRICPMFAKDVGGVSGTCNMIESNESSCHSFPNTMKGQSCMLFVELGMDPCGTVNNSLVVSKHLALLNNGYTEVVKGLP